MLAVEAIQNSVLTAILDPLRRRFHPHSMRYTSCILELDGGEELSVTSRNFLLDIPTVSGPTCTLYLLDHFTNEVRGAFVSCILTIWIRLLLEKHASGRLL